MSPVEQGFGIGAQASSGTVGSRVSGKPHPYTPGGGMATRVESQKYADSVSHPRARCAASAPRGLIGFSAAGSARTHEEEAEKSGEQAAGETRAKGIRRKDQHYLWGSFRARNGTWCEPFLQPNFAGLRGSESSDDGVWAETGCSLSSSRHSSHLVRPGPCRPPPCPPSTTSPNASSQTL